MLFISKVGGMEFQDLLDPIGADAPSGIELRNDPRFHAIERLLEPAARENKLLADGSLNESAPDVEWQSVLDQSLELAVDGRDLRLAVIIVRAVAALEDFDGLAQGLGFLADTVGKYWDNLHPALRERPNPKAASLPRINALKQLENDENGLLGDLKFSILLNMRGLGAFAGRDLAEAALSEFEFLSRAASGLNEQEKAALAGRHGQTVNRVSAAARALAAEEPERAAALVAALADCEAAISTLCMRVAEVGEFGGDIALTLPELSEFLGQMREVFQKGVDAMAGQEEVETEATEAPTAASGAAPAPKPAASGNGAALGAISSRRDVEKALDAIISFYERTEPSSPIPHLARRMRRMVPMDFLELMEEIAPSGMKEFSSVAGVDIKKK